MKVFICLILSFILLNCEVKVKESKAQSFGAYYSIQDLNIEGMTYRTFSDQRGGNASALFVVNLTKDKLEVEKLKLEIAYLTNQNNKNK